MSTPEPVDPRLLVQAYCDGELDPINARAVEHRIETEPALAAERDQIVALRHALHDRLPHRAMPVDLLRNLERAIAKPGPRFALIWNTMAASLAALIVLSAAALWLMFGFGGDRGFVGELTASHARALLADHLTDIASSDQHAIKPWFSTRTAQAPRVVDLTAEGYPLIGGRLDVVRKTPVPTLVYRHGGHVISVTQCPSTTAAGVQLGRHSVDGFHIFGWSEGDTSYWATSDVSAGELDAFVQKFRAASAGL